MTRLVQVELRVEVCLETISRSSDTSPLSQIILTSTQTSDNPSPLDTKTPSPFASKVTELAGALHKAGLHLQFLRPRNLPSCRVWAVEGSDCFPSFRVPVMDLGFSN